MNQQEMRSNSIGYMPGLDGMRALAVFAVIAYHLNLPWAPGGLLGVSLFFVLSGYLITNILLTQWKHTESIDLKTFWLRRARRLLPALFTMLAGVMSWVVLFAPERLDALKQEVLAAIFYISNWYLILHHVSYFESFGPQSPLGHLWSLAVEEQFYLIWPLLLGLGLRYFPQRKWIIGGTAAVALASVAAMALIYIPGHDPSRVYYGTDTRAFALLIGALLAMVWPGWKLSADLHGKKRIALDAVGSTGLLIVLLMIGESNQYQTFLYQGGLLLFSVAAACLVAALTHPASHLSRIFGWGPLRWLGECSYGIYLWHYPVIVLTSPAVNTEGLDLSRTLWQIAASIILAALSRYLIEEPIRYGRWKRFRRRKPWALAIKISVSFLLIFMVLFAAASEGTRISAKDLAENHVTVTQVQTDDRKVTAPEREVPDSDKGSGATGKKSGNKGNEITAIGDSLMIDAEPVLQKSLPDIVIDAAIGRQMYQAPDVIARLQREDRLGKIVIIELGTNGSFTEKQLIKVLESLKMAEKIILVNTRVSRPWEAAVNEMLIKVSGSYSNTKLIDWYAVSSGHDDYFYPDGVHLNRTGAEAYSKIMIEAMGNDEQ